MRGVIFMRKMKRIMACAASMAVILTGVSAPLSQADAEMVQTGWRGDVNYDGRLSVADIVVLQKHLSGIESLSADMFEEFADVTADGRVNIADLALLKKCLDGGTEWIGIFEEQTEPEPEVKPFINAPIEAFGASLPSQDEASLVIFYVDFPDCTYENKLTAEEVQNIAFGEENTESQYYPFESMSAFYDRSSKGAMNLTGKVFSYTAQNSISYYNEDKVALAKECFEAFNESEDFSQYDKDSDGMIDATLFTVPVSANEDHWWPCAGGFGDYEYTVDGVKVGHIITGNAEPSDPMNFNSSYLHEMGHCMGLPDYYLYYSDDFDSMHGSAGTELMDADAYSDFCSYSKLMLGWYREDQISVYDSAQGSQTFTLKNAQTDEGNCVIVPCGTLDENYFSEYFIIEYSTDGGNNTGIANLWWQEVESGVRIHHVYSEIYSDYWWTYPKYQNGSEFTGMNDDGIRLIRLVNDGNGPFRTGDIVSEETSGFGWYDSSENETIDTGITISIGELTEEGYTITIQNK